VRLATHILVIILLFPALSIRCKQEQCLPGDPGCNPIPEFLFARLAVQCTYEGPIQSLGPVEFQSGIGPTAIFDARISPSQDSILIAGHQDSGTSRTWIVARSDFSLSTISILDSFNPGSGASPRQIEFSNDGVAVAGSGDSGAGLNGFLRFSSDLSNWSTLDQYQYSGEPTSFQGVASSGSALYITGNVSDGTNSKLLSFLRKYDGSSSNVYFDNSGTSPGGPFLSPIKSNGLADFAVEYESVDGSNPATLQINQIREPFTLTENTYSFQAFSNPQKKSPVAFAVKGNDFFVPAYGPSSVKLMRFAGGAWSAEDTIVENSHLGSGLLATRTGPVVWAIGAGPTTSDMQLRVHVLRYGVVRRLNVPAHFTNNTTNQPQSIVELPNGDLIVFATSDAATQALSQSIAYRIPCTN
tara:strand:+ start:10692 stop:11930 length:1239 start_codon:yes stop_codon:yes gene_type:complete